MVKFSVITSFLGKIQDRFHEYSEDMSLEGKIRIVSEIEDTDGIECVFPNEVNTDSGLKELMVKFNVNLSAINVNVKSDPEFRDGGLSSNRMEIRQKAVGTIKKAKDFALEVGADKVTCCPLSDGYEFNFQTNYSRAWKNLIESFGDAGSYLPEIPLFIEYKPSETRGKCFIDNASKTLNLLNAIGIDNMGITLDFGHSIYAGENPSEALSLIEESKYPYYVHINDNDGKWDWDYFAGTKHFLDYVEFIYYLQEYKYSGYLTSDTSPTRWDAKGTFEANARLTKKLWNMLLRIDKGIFRKMITGEDYLKTWKFIEREIFSL